MYTISSQEGNCGLVWSHPVPTLQVTVLVLYCVHLQTLPHTSQAGHSWNQNPGFKEKPLGSHPGNAQVSGRSLTNKWGKDQPLASLLKDDRELRSTDPCEPSEERGTQPTKASWSRCIVSAKGQGVGEEFRVLYRIEDEYSKQRKSGAGHHRPHRPRRPLVAVTVLCNVSQGHSESHTQYPGKTAHICVSIVWVRFSSTWVGHNYPAFSPDNLSGLTFMPTCRYNVELSATLQFITPAAYTP